MSNYVPRLPYNPFAVKTAQADTCWTDRGLDWAAIAVFLAIGWLIFVFTWTEVRSQLCTTDMIEWCDTNKVSTDQCLKMVCLECNSRCGGRE